MEEYTNQIGYLSIFLFFFVVIGMGLVFLALSSFIGKKDRSGAKLETYECGKDPIGPGWRKYNVMFFAVAIAFLLFDVEMVFLYPVAVVLRKAQLWGFIEIAIFVGILFAGFIYLMNQGIIDFAKGKKKSL